MSGITRLNGLLISFQKPESGCFARLCKVVSSKVQSRVDTVDVMFPIRKGERRAAAMSIETKVKDILLEIFDVEEKDIVPTAHLRKDLDASSVDLVDLLAAVENEFNIEVSDEDAEDLLTVQAIIDYINENI
jgi:acyl carrier protein